MVILLEVDKWNRTVVKRIAQEHTHDVKIKARVRAKAGLRFALTSSDACCLLCSIARANGALVGTPWGGPSNPNTIRLHCLMAYLYTPLGVW